MTIAAAIHAMEVIPNAMSRVQDIPLSRIQESKTNPRRQFDETRLAELADNIRLHGVLQPIFVRHYQLGMADQVRDAVDKANNRLYGKRAALHFRDSRTPKSKEVKIAVCN